MTLCLLVTGGSAAAQCVGDCDNDGRVAVNELVTGVNIALDQAMVSVCPSFDTDRSDSVTVNELITGVNNALTECPVVAVTPTPTPTHTATAPFAGDTPTPTETPTFAPGVCGNGVPEPDAGETCDDGDTSDGPNEEGEYRCPADCNVAPCTVTGSTLDVDFAFTPPEGVELAGIRVFLQYPDGVVSIPGQAGNPIVGQRISNVSEFASFQFNDRDYGLVFFAFEPSGGAIPSGRLFTLTLDVCQGAALPTVEDFSCRVDDASPVGGSTVEGVTCAVTLP